MIIRRILVLITAVGLLLAGPATARADDRPTVSFDGEHWGNTVAQPLWNDHVSWVPGDSRTVSLWLRNDAPEPSRFAISVIVQGVDADSDRVPPLDGTVQIGDTRLVVGDQPMALPAFDPGVRRRVDLTLTLPASDRNVDQLRRAEVRVKISSAGPATALSGAVVTWPLTVAVGLLLAGAAVLAVRTFGSKEETS